MEGFGRGRGRGRGARLAEPTDGVHSLQGQAGNEAGGGGGGASASVSEQGHGRAASVSDSLSSSRPSESVAPSTISSSVFTTKRSNWDKKGKEGMPIPVLTNYIKMNEGKIELRQYRVDFDPPEDDTYKRKFILKQFNEKIGTNLFDGGMLYSTSRIKLVDGKLSQDVNGVLYTLSMKLVGFIQPEDAMFINFFNNVIRTCLAHQGMEQIGRNFFNRNLEIQLIQDGLVIWPGLVTAIRQHEKDVLLCIEVTHKVLRTESVLAAMEKINNGNRNFDDHAQRRIKEELKDAIIISHYNRKTYKIDDIDFGATPKSTFKMSDGRETSYIQYYKDRYNVDIAEAHHWQPMIVSLPKKKDQNKGIKDPIYLVPSLHHMTGLSDAMRKNHQLMGRMSQFLHMPPNERKVRLDGFLDSLTSNEQVKRELDLWKIQPGNEFVRANARQMTPENIVLIGRDGGEVRASPNFEADWTREIKNRNMIESIDLNGWLIFYPDRDSNEMDNFISQIGQQARMIGQQVAQPTEMFKYTTRDLLPAHIDSVFNRHAGRVKFIFVILPTNKMDQYMRIKKHITLECKVPSQCMVAKNLRHKNLASLCSKIMIQVNSKLGGIPWSIVVPFKAMMVLGFDVYHCPARTGYSVGALVSTISKKWGKYYSTASFHKDKSELATHLVNDISKCMDAYFAENNDLPNRLLFFRDGVGDGQIQYVVQHELEQIKVGVKDSCRKYNKNVPSISLVIVTKKINSRMIVEQGNAHTNVRPGTVLDDVITLPERYDFFLVSQCVRQGTVSPTNYNVVYDDSTTTPDQMQRLAYKMTHLYYNWSGTVAVPAPCLYAHKLAYLTGMSLAKEAPENLAKNLWYL